MSPDPYQQLVEFIAGQFDRQREETAALRGAIVRLDESLHGEIARVEVKVESLRHDIRGVADGVLANGQKIEANGVRIDGLSARLDRMEVRLIDHEVRIGRLEEG